MRRQRLTVLAVLIHTQVVASALRRPASHGSAKSANSGVAAVALDPFLRNAAVVLPGINVERNPAPAPGPAPGNGSTFAEAATPPPPPPAPPPTPPPPLPPKIPVATGEDCKMLEMGMIVSPKVKCQHIIMSSN